ncbi:MAG: pyruvate dehydrogenase complex dihydrolipoamide acetyltransferase [Chitinophagales bacterium]|nr:pyruvate dehydrogenase complex dihydrolipoamide acetyltransferase [Chitinophagales bacterium]MDW8427447.1 pyruvate dehydrogenase complex dihydrolipoamide acetyltransferase [Chitinophagales bacterium]
MAEVVRMPKMSDTMTEGVIVAWHKKVGDPVKPGDVLAEIETDKAVMEFESFQQGTLLYIGAEQGSTVKVNQVIAILGKPGENIEPLLQELSAAPVQTVEKKSEAAPAASDGKGKSSAEVVSTITVAGPPPSVDAPTSRIKASPLARKLAAEAGIPLTALRGTGDQGRIIKRDVEDFLAHKPTTAPLVAAGTEGFHDVPVSQMRKTIARRLSESMFTAPHFYLTTEINMDRCLADREELLRLQPDMKISINDIIVKAAALALKRHPAVNASWIADAGGQAVIRQYHHVHIGVAVAVDDGLLVPVIRHADLKTLSQISQEIRDRITRARDKKLQPEEMTGNTFTVSNLGMMDIDEFTAIINPPDSCILAVGKVKQTPVVVNNEIKIASVMKVTLSCDHRVVDGATGAKFLQTFKAFLENPLTMLV